MYNTGTADDIGIADDTTGVPLADTSTSTALTGTGSCSYLGTDGGPVDCSTNDGGDVRAHNPTDVRP